MPLDADIGERKKQLDTQEQDLARRQSALDQAGVQRAERQDTEMRPLETALTNTMAAPAPERPATHIPQPPDLKKLVDPKEYESLSYALIGMALVGGAASRGNWLGVSASLNGALKGYHEGNQKKTQDALEQYDRQFKVAKAEEDRVNKQFDDVLKNRTLSINEQLQRIKILAAQHGREDIRAAAEQKSIDSLHKQIEAGRTQLLGVEQRNEAVQKRLQVQLQIHQLGGNTPGGVQLTPEGQWFIEQTVAGGNTDLAKMVTSRFGRQMAIPIINDLARQAIADNTDPRDYTAAKLNVVAQQSALRQATVRLQGVDRLTTSVETLEKRVVDLTGTLNGQGIPVVNATVNAIRRNLGDGTLQELKVLMGSVGRQYVEAITMPGSNAQMHATAQDWANGVIHENMSLDQVMGALRGMNAEIAATRGALEKQITQPGESVKHGGNTLPRPGAAAPAAATPAAAAKPPVNASSQDILHHYSLRAWASKGEFPTERDAKDAQAAGLIKPGQRIKIGGKSATVKE